ncbi:SLATT domain-containing protein [Streptomyces sp. NPDC051940]|uniref:SLATT domain-containing protein n=1 Tax=Streptomyces sp. NPDC051940 TaxID=3155675 RepID=UPI003423D5E8
MTDEQARGSGPRRSRDLRGRPFPAPVPGEPRLRALDSLRSWAEQEAEDAVEWYFNDKRRKRASSRACRALTVILAVAGTGFPLAGAATGADIQGWGYVLLAAAAGCKAYDHFFGLSSGWMRDIAAAHGLRFRLNEFRLAWAAEILRGDPGEPEDTVFERRLAMITGLVDAVRGQVESEMTTWTTEFQSSIQQEHSLVAGPSAATPAQP